MKEIVNKTPRPIKVPLPGGKVLHLGPAKTGQVSDRTTESPAFRKLLDEGAIAIVGELEHHGGGPAPSQSGHASKHGHPQPTTVTVRGNR